MKTILGIIQYLPHKMWFLLFGFILTAEMGAELLTPFILQSLVVGSGGCRYYAVMIVCVILIAVGSFGQNQLYRKGILRIRRKIWKRFLFAPIGNFRGKGELLTLLMEDTERSMVFLQGFTCASLFRSVVYIVTSSVILGKHSLVLVGLVSGVTVSIVFFSGFLAKRRKEAASLQREQMTVTTELTAEILNARDEIWSFGQEELWLKKYEEHSRKIRHRRNRNTFWGSLSNGVDTLVESAAQPLALIVGIWLGQGEQILLMAGYSAILIKGGLSMMMFWNNAQSGIVSGQKVLEMMGDD